jgi:hypothetical protein
MNHSILTYILIFSAITPTYVNPCQPSPCGPNSQCKEVNNQAVCSCLPNYIGSPPGCRPECVVSSECSYDKACTNQKCVDPCPNTCGQNAKCRVNNHSPICYCMDGYTGDPFSRCYPQPRKPFVIEVNATCSHFPNFSFSTRTPSSTRSLSRPMQPISLWTLLSMS